VSPELRVRRGGSSLGRPFALSEFRRPGKIIAKPIPRQREPSWD
jgi:hypothetical protein